LEWKGQKQERPSGGRVAIKTFSSPWRILTTIIDFRGRGEGLALQRKLLRWAPAVLEGERPRKLAGNEKVL